MKRRITLIIIILILLLTSYSYADNSSASYSLVSCVFNSSGSSGQTTTSFKAVNSVAEPVINLFVSQNYYLKAGFLYIATAIKLDTTPPIVDINPPSNPYVSSATYLLTGNKSSDVPFIALEITPSSVVMGPKIYTSTTWECQLSN